MLKVRDIQMSWGALIAIIVIVFVCILLYTGKISLPVGLLLIGLAVARLT